MESRRIKAVNREIGDIDYVCLETTHVLHTAAYMFYKEENGEVIMVDNHGFTPSKKELLKLIDGLHKYIADTTDEEIQKYNTESMEQLNMEISALREPKPKKKEKGYVYLIKADNGLVKIGKTKNIEKRWNHFTTKLPYKLELLFYIDTEDMTGLELELHEQYRKYRKRGEWFELTERHINKIKKDHKDSARIGKTRVNAR